MSESPENLPGLPNREPVGAFERLTNKQNLPRDIKNKGIELSNLLTRQSALAIPELVTATYGFDGEIITQDSLNQMIFSRFERESNNATRFKLVGMVLNQTIDVSKNSHLGLRLVLPVEEPVEAESRSFGYLKPLEGVEIVQLTPFGQPSTLEIFRASTLMSDSSNGLVITGIPELTQVDVLDATAIIDEFRHIIDSAS